MQKRRGDLASDVSARRARGGKALAAQNSIVFPLDGLCKHLLLASMERNNVAPTEDE
jgi:hypothetical protein